MGPWPPFVFPGTSEECEALLAASRAGCTCHSGRDGKTLTCRAHRLLLDEQAVKYLIVVRRCRANPVAGPSWPIILTMGSGRV
jgi:hypothetical protein